MYVTLNKFHSFPPNFITFKLKELIPKNILQTYKQLYSYSLSTSHQSAKKCRWDQKSVPMLRERERNLKMNSLFIILII